MGCLEKTHPQTKIVSNRCKTSGLKPRFFNGLVLGVLLSLASLNTESNLVCGQSYAPHAPPFIPQNHAMSTHAGLRSDFPRSQTPGYGLPPKRRKVPTLKARYRVQDDDLFGEGQINPTSERSIFDQIEDDFKPQNEVPNGRPQQPQAPTADPFNKPRDRDPAPANPFGERRNVDPAPRTPPMDTQPERPEPARRPAQTPRQSGNGQLELPPGGEFTPDPDSIRGLPTPSGRTRETEKAGDIPSQREPTRREPIIEIEDLPGRFVDEDDELKKRVDELDRELKKRSSRRQRSNADEEEREKRRRRRSNASNVYRPAPEPTYYSLPTDPRWDAYRQQYRELYGQYPPGYDRDYQRQPDPRAAYPDPRQAPAPRTPYPVYPRGDQYVYAAPTNLPPPYGYICPPCEQPPARQDYVNQFAEPASSVIPEGIVDNIYEGVVSGDREIESAPVPISPRASRFGIGGLADGGGLRGDGPLLYYFSVFGGWNGINDLALDGDGGQIEIGNDDGVALGFAFGQILGKNLRSEIEFSYRTNNLDSLTLVEGGGAPQFFGGDGTIEAFSGMFNLYWDFVDLPTRRLKPYLGAGIGGVSVDADFDIDLQNSLPDGNDSSLAYQWIAGLNYQTTLNSEVFVEYRYFDADSLHFGTTVPPTSGIDRDGELDYQTGSILFGMRMKF